jgi:hypothetical protein
LPPSSTTLLLGVERRDGDRSSEPQSDEFVRGEVVWAGSAPDATTVRVASRPKQSVGRTEK